MSVSRTFGHLVDVAIEFETCVSLLISCIPHQWTKAGMINTWSFLTVGNISSTKFKLLPQFIIDLDALLKTS
jgi:hypothetical protein